MSHRQSPRYEGLKKMFPTAPLVAHAVDENESVFIRIAPFPIVKSQTIMNKISPPGFKVHPLRITFHPLLAQCSANRKSKSGPADENPKFLPLLPHLIKILPHEVDDLKPRREHSIPQLLAIFADIEARLKTHDFFCLGDEFLVFVVPPHF